MAGDPQLRQDIETAHGLGLPLSIFYGQPRETVTTARGSVLVPAWTGLDRALLGLWQDWRAELCPGCGEPLAGHPRSVDEYGMVPIRCAKVRAREEDAAKKDKRKPDPDAWTFPLYLRDEDARRVAEHVRDLRTTPEKE